MKSFLINLVVIPIVLALLALIGGFFGIILDIIPVIGDVIRIEGFPTPALTAWVLILAFLIAIFSRRGDGE